MFKFLPFIVLSIFVLGITSAKADVQISSDEVGAAIVEEFSNQGLDEDMELDVFGGQSSFFIPQAKQAKIMISNLKYDETQNKFSADVEIFADGKSVAKSSLVGKYYIMEEVYVPARNIDKGEILQDDDLKKIKIRSTRLKPMYVTDLSKLKGKEVKRALKLGKLISGKEVGEPLLVHKNDKVDLIYKTDRMQIIAKGIAQEDGFKGQKIEVENTQSHKKIYGTVISTDTIEIERQ